MTFFFVAIAVVLYLLLRTLLPTGVAKSWANFFILTWTIVLIVSSTNPYGIYPVDISTYFLFVIYITSFSFFFLLQSLDAGGCRKKSNNLQAAYDKLMRNKYFIFFLLSCALLLLYYVNKYINYISTVGIADARAARYYSGMVFSNGYEILLYNLIVAPFVLFIEFTVAFGLVFGRIKSISFLLSILVISLWMAFGAGRNCAIEIALHIIVLSFVKKSTSHSNGKISKIPLAIGALSLLIFSIFATAFRISEYKNIDIDILIRAGELSFEHLVLYLTGSIRAFQYAIENKTQYLHLSYGLLTFSGFDELISYVLMGLGIDTAPYSYRFGEILGRNIHIGGGNEFNALYTALYNFYFDFDLFGVIFLGGAFGYLSAKSLARFRRFENLPSLFAASILFVCSIWSIMSWRLGSLNYVLALCIAFWLSHPKTSRKTTLGRLEKPPVARSW